MLVDTGRRSVIRFTWTLVLGVVLGGILTALVDVSPIPDSAPRDFLLTSVDASIGPLDVDLVAVAFTLGPVILHLNFLTLVGVLIVALVVRSWI